MVSMYQYSNDLTITDVGRYQSTKSSTPPTLSCSYDSLYNSNDGYSVHGDYTFRRKHETNKERLIRQRAAFKLF